jgi:hypothetical protein
MHRAADFTGRCPAFVYAPLVEFALGVGMLIGLMPALVALLLRIDRRIAVEVESAKARVARLPHVRSCDPLC